MPTRPSQESNLGLHQTRLVLYQLSYRDQAETQPEQATLVCLYIYIYIYIYKEKLACSRTGIYDVSA